MRIWNIAVLMQLHQTLCNSMDCSPPGFSVPGIFQARIPEWVAISYSRGSSWPRDQTHISCILAGGFFTTLPPGKLLWNMNSTELSIEGFWSKFKQPWAADFDVVRCTFWILAVKMRKIFSSLFSFLGCAAQLVGPQFPDQGVNPGCDSESLES